MLIRTFSKSFYETFNRCAAHAALELEHGREVKTRSEQQAQGNIFHYLQALEGCLELMDAMEICDDEAIANWLAWTRNNYSPVESAHYEKALAADRSGNISRWGSRFLGAIIDRVGTVEDRVLITDWKTGRVMVKNEIEPLLSTYLVKLNLYPMENRFQFDYVYPRLETVDSVYITYKTDRTVLFEWQDYREEIKARGQDPLFKKIMEVISEVEGSDGAATPGPHCDNWYGAPCRFLGKECPLAEFMPDVYQWHDIENRVTGQIMELPEAQRPGAAFMAILRGYPIEKTPEIMSLAYVGSQQLTGGASKVMGQIREYCKETRLPIEVGGEKYGYQLVESIDTEKALRLLLAKADVEDVAKAVSISPSSLKRLGVRKHGDLIEQVKRLCTEKVRFLFGKLKEEESDGDV